MPLGDPISNRTVEQSFIDTAVKWQETYVAHLERKYGIPPRSVPVPGRGMFTTVSDTFEKWPEDALPAVLVIAPGLAGTPRVEADRTLTAPVAVAVGVYAASDIPGAGREIAQLIGAAYRQMFLNVRFEGLEGRFDGIQYLDERFGDVPGIGERTKAACRLVFTIHVKGWADLVGQPPGGPGAEPPDDPYDAPADLPKVESVYPAIIKARSLD